MTPFFRHVAGFLLIAGLVAGCLSGIGGCSNEGPPDQTKPPDESKAPAKEPPPAPETPAPETEPPAHQTKQATKAAAEAREPADNSICEVCHANFVEESLTTSHQKAGVGCAYCHGPSSAHAEDEANTILPDILFGRVEVPQYCVMCHKEKDHPKGEEYEKFLKKWLGEYRPNGRVITSDSICTDCHGNHAMDSEK